jgi:predicted dehydrogenase
VVDFSGELVFEGGASAGFHCSFLIADQQWANISGAQSSLRLSDFVLPRSDRHFAWEIGHQPVPKSETGIELGTVTAENSQETLLFRNFANQVRSGTLNEDWPNTALQTQQVMDTCLTSAHEGGRVVEVA